MADLKWKDGTAVTVLSTGLNSLANNTGAAATFQNTGLDLFCDIELYISSVGASVSQGTAIASIYFVPTADGTNFADGGDAAVTPQAATLVAVMEKRSATGTGAIRCIASGIPLPARDTKVVIINTSGQTFAASANTLKITPFKTQSV